MFIFHDFAEGFHAGCMSLVNINWQLLMWSSSRSVVFNVTFMHVCSADIPSQPEGPLETSNVFCNQMDLSWHAPLDDGSLPIDKYIVEKNEISHPNEWLPAGETNDTHITVCLYF